MQEITMSIKFQELNSWLVCKRFGSISTTYKKFKASTLSINSRISTYVHLTLINSIQLDPKNLKSWITVKPGITSDQYMIQYERRKPTDKDIKLRETGEIDETQPQYLLKLYQVWTWLRKWGDWRSCFFWRSFIWTKTKSSNLIGWLSRSSTGSKCLKM